MTDSVSYENDITRAEIIEATDELFYRPVDMALIAIDHTAGKIYKFKPEGFANPDFEMTKLSEESGELESEEITTHVIEILAYEDGQYENYRDDSTFVSIDPQPELATATEKELEEMIDVDIDQNFD